MTMRTLKIKIAGTTPLLMNSERGVNTADPLVIARKKLTDKKKKTDEDKAEIKHYDFLIAIYHDEKIGPYLPTWNLFKSIQEGARKSKAGRDVEQGVLPLSEMMPLQYDGPRSVDAIWKHGGFTDIRSVGLNGTKRVERTRPIFRQWTAEAEFAVDDSIIDPAAVIEHAKVAGKRAAIGDYRPRFGRYEVVSATHD